MNGSARFSSASAIVSWLNRPWAPFALVVLAVLLAHPWALFSDFFMDDAFHILESKGVAEGEWLGKQWRWIPYLVWSTIYGTLRLVTGEDPAHLAAFGPLLHLPNLLVHAATACLLFACAKDWFRRTHFLRNEQERHLAALLGAILFACHPLGTEPVHYARCLMIHLVTLFTVGAVWAGFRFLDRPSRRGALIAALAVAGAAASKQPGLIHAASSLAVVIAGSLCWRNIREQGASAWRDLPRSTLILVGVTVVLAISYLLFWIDDFGLGLQENFGIHALTQGRIFWSYVVRILVPVNLAADHWVPWSIGGGDLPAVVGTVAALILFAASAWLSLASRHRQLGMLLALALAPLAMRFGYVIRELMVEYRVYPSLPWIGLLAGVGLALLIRRKRPVGMVATAIVIFSFLGLSQHRSYQWGDLDRLLAANVEQYPHGVRAIKYQQQEAYRKQDWDQVLALMVDFEKGVQGCFEENQKNAYRQYDISRIGSSWCEAHQMVALALMERDGAEQGMTYAEGAIHRINQLYPNFLIDPGTGNYDESNALVRAWLITRSRTEKGNQTAEWNRISQDERAL
ncbi:MAG: hypothetical protein AAGJ31_09870 [Verrucomicrobiota bacterium]